MNTLLVFTKNADEYNMNKQLSNFSEDWEIIKVNENPNYNTILYEANNANARSSESFYIMASEDLFEGFDRDMKEEFGHMFNETGCFPERFKRLSEADVNTTTVNQQAKPTLSANGKQIAQQQQQQNNNANNPAENIQQLQAVTLVVYPCNIAMTNEKKAISFLEDYIKKASVFANQRNSYVKYIALSSLSDYSFVIVENAISLINTKSNEWSNASIISLTSRIDQDMAKLKINSNNVFVYCPVEYKNTFIGKGYQAANINGVESLLSTNAKKANEIIDHIKKDIAADKIDINKKLEEPTDLELFVVKLANFQTKDVSSKIDIVRNPSEIERKLKAIEKSFRENPNTEEYYKKSKDALDKSGMGFLSDAAFGKGEWNKEKNEKEFMDKMKSKLKSEKSAIFRFHPDWKNLIALFNK